MTANELTKKIHQGIPLTQAMAFDITELTETSIAVKTGGEENVNVHGTAFAGSLYTTCVLAAWGLVNSRLPEEASLVLASGHIDYLSPVVGDICARGEIPKQDFDQFLTAVNEQGRSRLDVEIQVEHEGVLAAKFTGQVHARIKQ